MFDFSLAYAPAHSLFDSGTLTDCLSSLGLFPPTTGSMSSSSTTKVSLAPCLISATFLCPGCPNRDPPTTGMILPSSTTKLSFALSLTSTMFLCRDFHFGRSPFVALPTPISLHTFGGLTPISTRFVHIRSPLLLHLAILATYSSSEGCHLLFSMRRMASGLTLKCSAKTGVVNLSGWVLCRCRMPSIVSGDSFLRGFQASPPSFSLKASFCIAQTGRSRLA